MAVAAFIASQVAGRAANSARNSLANNSKWIVLAAIFFFVWVRWLSPWVGRITGKVPDDAPYVPGEGDVLSSFDVKYLVDQLYKGLKQTSYTGNDTRCTALQTATDLNSNQLILLHNTYKNKYGHTLHSAVRNVTGDGCWNLFKWELNSTLATKLSDLGLV
jgi:hypothetical protein